ncbi:MAG: SAM hydrolase/SAM-dependent halogenase family protein [Chloroflexota bacterium]
MRTIVLLTDFGLGSAYVGEVKGVLAALAPGAVVVDLCHDIRPQAVAEAAFLLGAAWKRFPRGSVFVCVVDPDVGGERAILALETREAVFLAPDNGLLSHVWAEFVKRETIPGSDAPPAVAGEAKREPTLYPVKRETFARLFAVTNRRLFLPRVSSTFHGRDVFAPVAARLALGLSPRAVGPRRREAPVLLPLSAPERTAEGALRCHVAYIDRFGNLITDARAEDLPPGPLVVAVAGRRVVGLSRAYRDGPDLLALVDSWDRLEIAARDASAAALLGLSVGDPVLVLPKSNLA